MRSRQNTGYLAGILFGLLTVAILWMPGLEKLHARGPMNSGHEELACRSCHVAAPGTARQQIQAILRHRLGLRDQPATFGLQEVGNPNCLSCHDRPNERHPVFRFLEPRFATARGAIAPHQCISCHVEHQGARVTLPESGFCVHCHGETKLVNDPVSTPHVTLVETGRWQSCLGCHDYHGNHVMATETSLARAHSPDQVMDYFAGAPSPYSHSTYFRAREEGSDGQ